MRMKYIPDPLISTWSQVPTLGPFPQSSGGGWPEGSHLRGSSRWQRRPGPSQNVPRGFQRKNFCIKTLCNIGGNRDGANSTYTRLTIWDTWCQIHMMNWKYLQSDTNDVDGLLQLRVARALCQLLTDPDPEGADGNAPFGEDRKGRNPLWRDAFSWYLSMTRYFKPCLQSQESCSYINKRSSWEKEIKYPQQTGFLVSNYLMKYMVYFLWIVTAHVLLIFAETNFCITFCCFRIFLRKNQKHES